MKKKLTTSAMVLGLALSGAMAGAHAQATRPGAYAGIGAGQSEAWDYNCDPLPNCKKKGTAFRVFGGWQFNRILGVEASLADLGKVSSSSSTFDQSIKFAAGDVMLFAQWPLLENLSLYGKVGGYYGKVEADTTNAGVSTQVSESKGNATYAGGIQWFITPGIAVRGEGQRYLKVGGGSIGQSDYSLYSINLLYKF